MAGATLVQSSAIVTSTTNSITCTIAGSTAGHLLVATVFAQASISSGIPSFTYPAGWSSAIVGNDAPTRVVGIGYFPNNSGGITSIVITVGATSWSPAVMTGMVTEWSSVATTTPLDRTGTALALTGTAATVTTSATLTANNELAVTVNSWTSATAAKNTWTPPAGWTNLASDGATKQTTHFTADYFGSAGNADTGASSGATFSETAAGWSTTGSQTMAIATFKTAAAAAQIWQPPAIRKLQAVQQASTW